MYKNYIETLRAATNIGFADDRYNNSDNDNCKRTNLGGSSSSGAGIIVISNGDGGGRPLSIFNGEINIGKSIGNASASANANANANGSANANANANANGKLEGNSERKSYRKFNRRSSNNSLRSSRRSASLRSRHIHKASKRKSDMSLVPSELRSNLAKKSDSSVVPDDCSGSQLDQDDDQRDSSSTESLPLPHEPDAIYLCSKRLKRLLQQLTNNEKVETEDLIYNISYATDVLNAVLEENARRLNEDDNEINEIQSNSVPDQVRDWLASTFTRSMSTARAPLRERLKFKSVVQAVRAGITVERLYRRMSSLPFSLSTDVQGFLSENMDSWSVDVFRLNELTGDHSLKIVGYQVLHRYDLIKKLKISVSALEAFLNELEIGYSRHANPYHNLIHAADVTQTVHYLICKSKIVNWLTDLEILAVLVAALVHDVDHTGTTNGYHINSDSELALLYNDRSVLENHHLATCFKLLHSDDCNILKALKRDDYRTFRSNVIEIVLSTDMSLHFQQLKTMKSLLASPEHIDKPRALAFIVHSADISHPAKNWELHHRWTDMLLEEFFRQGDREKDLNLPFSPLCDRATTLVPESQIGFIEFIVAPTFVVLGDMIDKVTNQELGSSLSSGSTFALLHEVIDEANEAESPDKKSISPALLDKSNYPLDRVWEQHLAQNKATWQERTKKGKHSGNPNGCRKQKTRIISEFLNAIFDEESRSRF